MPADPNDVLIFLLIRGGCVLLAFFYQDAFLWAVLCFLSKALACQRTRGGRQGWVNTQPVEAGECVCKVSDVRKEEEGKHGGDAKILVDDGGNHIDQYARHHGESCLCALVLFRFLFEEFTSRAPLPSSCHLVVWSVPTALATSWCLPYYDHVYWSMICGCSRRMMSTGTALSHGGLN